MKHFCMRGDFMKTAKHILVWLAVFALLTALLGCAAKPNVPDKEGMVYADADMRSIYANVFDFDAYDGQPYFAVAFLGYGDRMRFRDTYVEGIFQALGKEAIGKISHIDYEGDEWYLIVPRYKEDVEIKNLETGDVHTVYNGEAFTVKCNLSDLHPNLEISTEQNLSGHIFSPQIGGDGKLVQNPDVWDITDYTVMNENIYVQEGE